MEKKEDISLEVLKSTVLLLTEFTKIDDRYYNVKPDVNVWSAGNIAEHIIILENSLNKILVGKTKPADRDPFEIVEKIKSYLLNFEEKLNAPEPIAPKKVVIEKDYILNEFKSNRNTLLGIIESNDITLTCLDFQHRLFGELTRAEWIYFIIYHTERHIHQLSKLAGQIGIQ